MPEWRVLSEQPDNFWEAAPWLHSPRKYALGMRPLGVDEQILHAPSGQELSNKKRQLARAYERVVQVFDPGAQDALDQLNWPTVHPPSQPDPIASKALCVAEDLCLLDISSLRLVAACVCAPSYWRLIEKIGQPIDAIHAPVHGLNAMSGERIAHTLRRLPPKRGFVRENWLVHGDHQLAHFETESDLPLPVKNWVMRCERQTLYRLTERYLLFAIRIRSADLCDVVAYPQVLRGLLEALRMMSVEQVDYFGGAAKHAALIDWLEAHDEQMSPLGEC